MIFLWVHYRVFAIKIVTTSNTWEGIGLFMSFSYMDVRGLRGCVVTWFHVVKQDSRHVGWQLVLQAA